MKKRHKQGGLDEGKYSAIKYGLEIYTIHKVIKPAEMRGKLRAAPLGKYWNIGRVKYHLKKTDGKVLIAKKDGYNKKPYPVAIYGSDLLLVDKDQSQPTVNSYDRIKEINRFTAYTPSQQEIDNTQDRILKEQASFEEKQRLQKEKEAAEAERQRQIDQLIKEMRIREEKEKKEEEERQQRNILAYQKRKAEEQQRKRNKEVKDYTKQQQKALQSIQKEKSSLEEKVSTSRGRSKAKFEKELEALRGREVEIQAILDKFAPSMTGTGILHSTLYSIPFVDVFLE